MQGCVTLHVPGPVDPRCRCLFELKAAVEHGVNIILVTKVRETARLPLCVQRGVVSRQVGSQSRPSGRHEACTIIVDKGGVQCRAARIGALAVPDLSVSVV